MADLEHDGHEGTLLDDDTNKKCPNCAAAVTYDPATRGMLCEYCGFKKTLPAPEDEEKVDTIDFSQAEHTKSFAWGQKKKTVECQNCGAHSIYDVLETAAMCPFCGSTKVMPAHDEQSMAPGGVCAFVIPLKTAGERFKKWLKSRIFVPSKAKKQARPQAFTGVYVPYWSFDVVTSSPYRGRAGFDQTVRQANGTTTTQTKWRHVKGLYQEDINNWTVFATKKQAHNQVCKAEPFDFSKLVPYRPELLAGFVAERYSIGLQDGWTTAQDDIRRHIKHQIEREIRARHRADRAQVTDFSTEYDKLSFKYILMPVWISSFIYKGKDYQFVVNGQTGKVAGKAPISPLRIFLAILILLLIVAVFLWLLTG